MELQCHLICFCSLAQASDSLSRIVSEESHNIAAITQGVSAILLLQPCQTCPDSKQFLYVFLSEQVPSGTASLSDLDTHSVTTCRRPCKEVRILNPFLYTLQRTCHVAAAAKRVRKVSEAAHGGGALHREVRGAGLAGRQTRRHGQRRHGRRDPAPRHLHASHRTHLSHQHLSFCRRDQVAVIKSYNSVLPPALYVTALSDQTLMINRTINRYMRQSHIENNMIITYNRFTYR